MSDLERIETEVIAYYRALNEGVTVRCYFRHVDGAGGQLSADSLSAGPRTGSMPRVKKCVRCGKPFDEAKARGIFDPEYGKNIYDGKYRAEVCHDCVMLDMDSDEPEEIWFECDDCEGTTEVFVPDGPDENVGSMEKCPGCGGLGMYEGTPDDLPSKSKRVFNF